METAKITSEEARLRLVSITRMEQALRCLVCDFRDMCVRPEACLKAMKPVRDKVRMAAILISGLFQLDRLRDRLAENPAPEGLPEKKKKNRTKPERPDEKSGNATAVRSIGIQLEKTAARTSVLKKNLLGSAALPA